MRGFGIDAGTPVDVATEVAVLAEQLGYETFWVNGSPHEGAFNILQSVAEQTSFDLGVGVFPLTRISGAELVAEVRDRGLPQGRLWLGVGSNRKPGALAEVREAAKLVRSQLDSRFVMGAIGPKMTELAGEIADVVIFTWWIAAEVQRSRVHLEAGAAGANRDVPTVVSFIRSALLPEAAEAVVDRAAVYSAIPHYQAVFDRNRMSAEETIVTGSNREELAAGISREESVLDESVVRAIPAAPTVEALARLAEACAP